MTDRLFDYAHAVCVTAGYVLSYWNRPFFPEGCVDASLDDYVDYDTMLRIGGSFSGFAEAFKAITDWYGWRHIVLVSNDMSLCWYGAKPFLEVIGQDANYTFTWLRLGVEPTDEQLHNVLEQIRALTRGLWL